MYYIDYTLCTPGHYCLAKIAIYWPNMMKDINNYVENCQICQERQRVNTKEPLMYYEIPKLLW